METSECLGSVVSRGKLALSKSEQDRPSMQNSLPQESHSLRIGAVQRDLPLFAVSPELAIAVLNILGDTELCEAAADALSKELDAHEYVALVTAEAKSIPLAYALSLRTQKPYVVLRKTYKSYMGDALQASTLSITTGKPQTLYLDAKDRKLLAGRSVVLVDDVISTGSTLEAMRALMVEARARIAAVATICTEGERPQLAEPLLSLAHLPLFPLQTAS
ncbi:adenine phosphoribosyltransferase [Acidithiobacillus sp. YTS05]|nr:phosphoribosyltransferase family protein [Igneacidithiobacillus copahuensis]UTV81819.1 adenine phosphoribosyltransferase [Acidithiobacillus sp. YTS05]